MATKKESDAAKMKKSNSWSVGESPAVREKYIAAEREKNIQARKKFNDLLDKKNEEKKAIRLKNEENEAAIRLKNEENQAAAIRLKITEERAIKLKEKEIDKENEATLLAIRLKWDEDIKVDAERLSLEKWEVTRFRRQAVDKANQSMLQFNREALKSNKPQYIGFDKLLGIEQIAQIFYKDLIEKPQVIEQVIEVDKKSIIKNEAKIKADQAKCNKVLNNLFITIEPDIRKIGQLLDLCCNLIPESIAKKIKDDCLSRLKTIERLQPLTPSEVKRDWLLSPKTLADIFLSSFYRIIDNDLWTISSLRNNKFNYSGNSAILFLENLIAIPEYLLQDYNVDLHVNYSFEDYNKNINKYKKSHSYTVAIIETIFFLLTSSEIKKLIIQSDFVFKKLNSFGDLLIDMGSFDSALRVFNIDKSIFHTPQQLSLLANAVIQSGNVTDSIILVKMLLEQEPFYPSIPRLQSEIKRLEQRHLLNSELSIDFSKVEQLSGIEFENLLLDKFVKLGFKVEPTPKTGDFGADLIVENQDGSRIIFQCKRFKSKVNLKAVQEVVGAMGHYAGDYGVVITNNTFLNSAVKLAQSHDIELWDGDKLVSFLAGDLSFSEILS